MSDGLIITGSFNGLLDRLSEVDHFNVWYERSKSKKVAKKQKREPTIRMSEVCTLTGLTREDVEFFVSLRFIECVEAGEDPLLSFRDVFCLVKVFEGIGKEGVNPS